MKKIMFDDSYGLTRAVLEGRKTMTRRLVTHGTPFGNWEDTVKKSRFQVGEVVAVAQSYNDSGWNPNTLQQTFVKEPTVFPDLDPISPLSGWIDLPLKYHKGWSNKMFVYAGLMPHQIRFTNIRVERLQDISEDDVYKEGFSKESVNNGWGNAAWHWEAMLTYYDGLGRTREIRSREPKEAFSFLIDHICGNGTWERNPLVFCYEFELVK